MKEEEGGGGEAIICAMGDRSKCERSDKGGTDGTWRNSYLTAYEPTITEIAFIHCVGRVYLVPVRVLASTLASRIPSQI